VKSTEKFGRVDRQPNLQNIHTRTELGRLIRETVLKGLGWQYAHTVDYGQVERDLIAGMKKCHQKNKY